MVHMCIFVEMFCCQWQPLGQLVVIVVVYVGSFSGDVYAVGRVHVHLKNFM